LLIPVSLCKEESFSLKIASTLPDFETSLRAFLGPTPCKKDRATLCLKSQFIEVGIVRFVT
jgi:hypothetical protein